MNDYDEWFKNECLVLRQTSKAGPAEICVKHLERYIRNDPVGPTSGFLWFSLHTCRDISAVIAAQLAADKDAPVQFV